MKGFIVLMATAMMLLYNKNHMENTVWICNVAKGCVDTLYFKSSKTCLEYDCELNYTAHGSYRLVKDTLFLTIKDDSHSEDNSKIRSYKTKFLIKDKIMYDIGIFSNGKWKFADLKSGISNPYHRVH